MSAVLSQAERLLNEAGLEIVERDLGDPDPATIGFAGVWPLDGALRVLLVVQLRVGDENRAEFADWAWSRLDRLRTEGPEPDGWTARADGGWQMWARLRWLG